ncbi:unnamed protein product [Plutella xylostella]|uniref:(diamondback moth) hypothetical protein n=1 Tax=Plutella xylostella TaxID=51655 RepID=A0A8S4FQA9_PLUXY|nr:unnamed protein product [Plutella xylostella]
MPRKAEGGRRGGAVVARGGGRGRRALRVLLVMSTAGASTRLSVRPPRVISAPPAPGDRHTHTLYTHRHRYTTSGTSRRPGPGRDVTWQLRRTHTVQVKSYLAAAAAVRRGKCSFIEILKQFFFHVLVLVLAPPRAPPPPPPPPPPRRCAPCAGNNNIIIKNVV